MKPKWTKERDNADGTGAIYYKCCFPDPNSKNPTRQIVLCFRPLIGRLWHFTTGASGAVVSYDGATWRDAGRIKTLLQNKRTEADLD